MKYSYLNSLQKFGMNLWLERITYLLEKLNNPHLKFKSIHIAGTNGKGSTAVMISSILKEAGYKVGLYTSPHLFDYTERVKINGRDISSKEFKRGLAIIEKVAREPRILFSGSRAHKETSTIFEVLTALAFWYFAKKGVDYAVVEVGLGGRLDATNVLTPLASVITNIELEHTEILGKTLSKITAEKAAIIKPGVPAVTAEHKKDALQVIKRESRRNKSVLIAVSRKQLAVSSSLIGEHQKLNAACAIAAIRLARIKVTKKAIKQGLQKAKWPGRFQVVSKKPLVIVDGAHNPAGAKVLVAALKKLYPKTKFTIIYGCQKTKDHKSCLKFLKPVTAKLIKAKSSHPEASQGLEINKALALWDGQSPLLVTGSLFLVADVLTMNHAQA
ncbi:MAG: bifunctional folylpolyglutamate synthase/dihydrofolate synthase [Candidatus Margulisbacteria bacterium]|nr:bifunctional folylpolyglutamate synthase/dihydrofolate synthase [Candidatus Margulisiibacteriota bacterium]